MEETPPPDLLAYNLGGTNHTFFAAPDICGKCHSEIEDAISLQTAFQTSSVELKGLVEQALLALIGAQTATGRTIDLNGDATVADVAEIAGIDFGEYRGSQAITVTLSDDSVLGPYRMNDVSVIEGLEVIGSLYDFADARLVKAGWNWNLGNNDGSQGAHNPSFVFAFLDASADALTALLAE
jgi:hypothetical protein